MASWNRVDDNTLSSFCPRARPVTSPTLCHTEIWATRHPQNITAGMCERPGCRGPGARGEEALRLLWPEAPRTFSEAEDGGCSGLSDHRGRRVGL